jgi:hypothetical protein
MRAIDRRWGPISRDDLSTTKSFVFAQDLPAREYGERLLTPLNGPPINENLNI